MTDVNWTELDESIRAYLAHRQIARLDVGHMRSRPPKILDIDAVKDPIDAKAKSISTGLSNLKG